MEFEETLLPGVFIITYKRIIDERGFFSRTFCATELSRRNLNPNFVQCNISFNQKKGTTRGLHYQSDPHGETKIVSCRRGALYDVVVDICETSPSFGQWIAVELSEKKPQALYIPKGLAHGFQTLCDETEVFYLMGDYYMPSAVKGIRWDDPFLNITWPLRSVIISERDKNLPRLKA